jgi:hypothetical protein
MSLIIGGIGFGTLDSLTSGEKSTFDYYLPIGATVLSSFFLLFALKTITFEREVVRIAKLICTLLAVPLVELNIYLWVKIGGAMGGIGATLSKVGRVFAE